MKFVCISDTHGKHYDINLPKGDVLIHAGDITSKGQKSEVFEFLEWFEKLDFEYKIFIAGNHDFYFEKESFESLLNLLPRNIIYLQDSGISIGKFRLWGSPVTPWFFNWAFNRHRGEQINRHWLLIPPDTDILITHGPVFGTLDQNKKGEHLGCNDLFNSVQQVKPKVHICGHIHEAYGSVEKFDTRFINASVLNEQYEVANPPVVFDL